MINPTILVVIMDQRGPSFLSRDSSSYKSLIEFQ